MQLKKYSFIIVFNFIIFFIFFITNINALASSYTAKIAQPEKQQSNKINSQISDTAAEIKKNTIIKDIITPLITQDTYINIQKNIAIETYTETKKDTQFSNITLLTFFKQFDNATTIFEKQNAIENAYIFGETAQPFYEYAYQNSDIDLKAVCLKTMYYNKLNFPKLIFSAITTENEILNLWAIRCAILLKQEDKHNFFNIVFSNKQRNARANLIPILFTAPEDNINFIRQALNDFDAQIRLTAYKHLVKLAPNYFNLVCLGVFDDDVNIVKFVLSKHLDYKENGKKLIYYGLKSEKSSIVEYAKALLLEYYKD